ncbi:MAG: hypothetical protein IKB61_01275 [Elusimicrobiaceae bacterium]|nr:hypothetical protein [Elusimicrobiaceae bacterium]
MADEKINTPDIAEFEAKLPAQANNKDIWLFLIIVDVVLLCVFGFFLYKNLSARLLAPENPAQAPAAVVEETLAEESIAAEPEEVVTVPEAIAPVVPEPVVQEVKAPVVEEPKATAEEVKEPAQPAEKKESIIVKKKAGSKYRQVTFRYYGEGKNVAVVSGFTMAKPRALRKKDGYWETTLSISPGTYKFLYVVDGVQKTDPYAEEKDGRSVLVVE